MTDRKKIVILGAGFGGMYCYFRLAKKINLKKHEIVLINKTNHFIFTPLMHEVATGALGQNLVVEPIRKYTKDGACFLQDEVVCVKTKEKIIDLKSGEQVVYDYLVVALGAKTNYFNVPGAEKYALPLKTLDDAVKMRREFIDSFEEASKMESLKKRQKHLSFVVVGGGPTGVEIASEMAEFFNDTFKKYYPDITKNGEVKIFLINSKDHILSQYSAEHRALAAKTLKKQGVKLYLSHRVTEIKKDRAILDSGEEILSDCVIWASGVMPNTLICDIDLPLDRGRILVDKFLQIQGCDNIFAVGDVAAFKPHEAERPLPMLAQVAMRQGKAAADNIVAQIKGRPMKPFSYKLKGLLVSLGQWNALADIKKIRLAGIMASFLWRGVYLFKFISNSKRIRILVDWIANAFSPRDISKAS